MTIYFIKATFVNNNYLLTDFYNYTGGVYTLKQNANKKMEVDMAVNDGPTILETQISILPDSTNVREHTHIVIPDKMKIYKITTINDLNNDARQITLEDDPFIANWQNLQNKVIHLTRSNSPDFFNGVVDIPDFATKKTTTILKTALAPAGTVAVVFLQPPETGSDYSLKFHINLTNDVAGREYSSTTTLNAGLDLIKADFPEVATTNPGADPTFQKFAKVNLTGSGYNQDFYYQRIYINGYMKWFLCYAFDVGETTLSFTSPTSRLSLGCPRNTPIIIPMSPIIQPVMPDINFKHIYYPCFVGPGAGTTILSVRLIDSSLLGLTNITSNAGLNSLTPTWENNLAVTKITSPVNWSDLYKLNFIKDIDVSYTRDNYVTSLEPFTKYILDIYGNKHQINSKYLSNLKVTFNLTPSIMSYYVWSGNKQTILASGIVNNETQYTVDLLDKFNTVNPTFKDQWNLDRSRAETKAIIGTVGAAGGAALLGGGITGSAIGAAAGLINYSIDEKYSRNSEKLREKSLRLQPDEIQGNLSDIGINLTKQYGIFLLAESVSSDTKAYNQMRDLYGIRGYQTDCFTKIDEMDVGSTSLLYLPDYDNVDYCYIMEGSLVETVGSTYVTNEINKKLQEGVIVFT